MSGPRAQVALEFMVLAAAIFAVFGYIMYQAQLKYISFDRLSRAKQLDALGYELATAIGSVCDPGSPSEARVKVPAAPFTRVHSLSQETTVLLLREGFSPARVEGLAANDRVRIENRDSIQLRVVSTDGRCTSGYGDDELLCGRKGVFVSAMLPQDNRCFLLADAATQAGCDNVGGTWVAGPPASCDVSVTCAAHGGAMAQGPGGTQQCNVPHRARSRGRCQDGERWLFSHRRGQFMAGAGPGGADLCVMLGEVTTPAACQAADGTWVAGPPASCDVSVPCVAHGGAMVNVGGTMRCNLASRARSQELCLYGPAHWVPGYDRTFLAVADSDTLAFVRPGLHTYRIETDPPAVPPRTLEVLAGSREVRATPSAFTPAAIEGLPIGGSVVFRNAGGSALTVVSAEQACSNAVDPTKALCELKGAWKGPLKPASPSVFYCAVSSLATEDACKAAWGTWLSGTSECVATRRTTKAVCEAAGTWGPRSSLALAPGASAEVRFPRRGTFAFSLQSSPAVTFSVRVAAGDVVLGSEHLNTLRELRRAAFKSTEQTALTVFSLSGTCANGVDRSKWACVGNGAWQADPPRCAFASMNSRELCEFAGEFWDPAANACYVLERGAGNCAAAGDPAGWTPRALFALQPGEEKYKEFPEDQWPGPVHRFYIEPFRWIALDVSEDSRVEVRAAGLVRHDAFDPLARSQVPLAYAARTEPFDFTVRGAGALEVSCQDKGKAGERVDVFPAQGGAQ